MWCGIKFTSGYTCVRSQLYQILLEDFEGKERKHEEFADCVDTLKDGEIAKEESGALHTISIHALVGTEGPHTMRLRGKIKNQTVVILVDSRSTHNFLDQNTAKKLNCSVQVIHGLTVIVANGDMLRTQGLCEGV